MLPMSVYCCPGQEKRYVRNLINGVTMKVEEIERLLAEFYEGKYQRAGRRVVEGSFQNRRSARALAEGQETTFSAFFPG